MVLNTTDRPLSHRAACGLALFLSRSKPTFTPAELTPALTRAQAARACRDLVRVGELVVVGYSRKATIYAKTPDESTRAPRKSPS